MRKRLTALVLILMCLVHLCAPALAASGFWDVPSDAYYANAVRWAVNHNPVVTNGTSAGQFSPNIACTRAQAVTFLWRSMPGEAGTENPFTDLEPGAYYFVPVLWAAKNGITQGTGGGTFNPDDACLRAQIVTFLYRAVA